jgi:hypothetical protein
MYQKSLRSRAILSRSFEAPDYFRNGASKAHQLLVKPIKIERIESASHGRPLARPPVAINVANQFPRRPNAFSKGSVKIHERPKQLLIFFPSCNPRYILSFRAQHKQKQIIAPHPINCFDEFLDPAVCEVRKSFFEETLHSGKVLKLSLGWVKAKAQGRDDHLVFNPIEIRVAASGHHRYLLEETLAASSSAMIALSRSAH